MLPPHPSNSGIDDLTGLMTVQAWWKRPSTSGVSVAYLDIDNLIKFNHVYGYQIVDVVLQRLAGRLQRYLRSGEQLYRMDGDEFMVVYPQELDMDALRDRIHTLQKCWDAIFIAQGQLIQLSVSGVVTNVGATSPETFRDLMLEHLYVVKKQGTNQVMIL